MQNENKIDLVKNNKTTEIVKNTKEYATDKAGMLRDAQDWARREYANSILFARKLGISEDDMSDEQIGKKLILVKYDIISESRLNRTSIFDHS